MMKSGLTTSVYKHTENDTERKVKDENAYM